MIHIMARASIRQLRTEFPKVRAMIEREGEVVVTERGQAAYVIRPYQPPKKKRPKKKDYFARLLSYMPKPISEEAMQEIDRLNRGER